jgi:hypothetical protein
MELKGSRFLLSYSRRSLSKESSLRFLLSSVHETLSVAAMRVNDEDRSPRRIHGRDTTSYSSGFTEIVSDY